jgi:twitching motility protein PilT
MQIVELLRAMEERNASDLFVSVDKRPHYRIMRSLVEADPDTVTDEQFREFLGSHLPAETVARLEKNRDLDIGVSLEDSRFRFNIYYQKGELAMVVRRVPSGALSFSELALPTVLTSLAEAPRGLVLVTGSTGSGKSTTMAAMLHHINSSSARHIVTVEDPIEFVHQDLQSVVNQREIGTDTTDFFTSLRHIVRQSPDVIIIGEMRDLDTISTAVSAAMTGHLVISTMHTVDVVQTLERIINYFPDQQRDQIALDLGFALRGIVSQRLLPCADGNGVVPALEILVATPLVRRLVHERDFEGLEQVIKTGASEGMQTFTRALADLVEAEKITVETGAAAATNRDEFLLAVEGMQTGIETFRTLENADESFGYGMKSLLRAAVRHGASDLLLTAKSSPLLRIDGELMETNTEALSPTMTKQLLFSVLSPSQRTHFELEKEIDFALSVDVSKSKDGVDQPRDQHRFRVNGFYQKGTVSVALRVINQKIPTPKELNLPKAITDLSNRAHGLLLITGPTGHGKSTTMACLLSLINKTRACHIITIEDPIEYVHTNDKAVVEQREVFADTKSFTNALKYILRQDPDVIMIGEMRDPETISAALTAAETGHLVLATLHTNDAVQSVDRIIDAFPAHQQSQIRTQLAATLIAVVSQRLLPTVDGEGRVPAFEIMIGTPAVHALIRDERTHQIPSSIETSAKDGMVTMDRALQNLYRQNLVSRQTVLSLAKDKDII